MKMVHFKGAETGSPDSAAWHAWRRAGIGGSDAAVIAFNAGLLPAEQAAKWQRDYAGLLAEKRGEETKPDRPNFAAARGKALESTVAEMVKSVTGIPFMPAFGEMDAHPIVRSSFDGVTFDLECIQEIKVANEAVHEAAKDNRVIPYYQPQVAHQALTAWGPPEGWGNDRALFFCNYREADEKNPLAIVEAPSSSDWLKRMAEGLLPLHLAFWKEVMQGREVPEDVRQRMAEFAALKAQADAIDKALEQLRKPLVNFVEAMGVPKFEFEGFVASRTVRAGSIDIERACAELGIDPTTLDKYRKPTTSSWTLKVVK